MPPDRATCLRAIAAFCAAHPAWVLFDEGAGTFLEVATGKRLSVPLSEVMEAHELTNERTGRPYLLIELGDQRELAVCDAGIAFAPQSQGADTPELPPVVCLKDFRTVRDSIAHALFGHRDQKPGREVVEAVMLALGILGGARRLGFDVGTEERDLELLLTELENRR